MLCGKRLNTSRPAAMMLPQVGTSGGTRVPLEKNMVRFLDNFSGGLAASAFVAYLSSLTNLKFSATQYAMLSSTMLLLPRFIGGYSGTMVESLGYEHFFYVTAVMGIPTLLLIGWLWLRRAPSSASPTPTP